jgi:hypothetical protein
VTTALGRCRSTDTEPVGTGPPLRLTHTTHFGIGLPGSSTEELLASTVHSGQFFFSSTSLGLPTESASARIEKSSAIVASRR